ncbi:MAG: SUMF1/EgtB/PvdO family nonheme iron enzyme, partial [Anaerolineales bacterium]|nr:SUMF1/EgtB/PvdO family nonheme iron enzyme [Anaerolineales bacterium]
MAKKPEDRYLTMSDLAAALERLAQVAGPVSAGPRARPWLWVGAVGLAAVAGCVILAGGGWLALRGLGVGVLGATATAQLMAAATAPTPSALPPSTAAATEPPPPTLAPTLAATIAATEAPAGLPVSEKDGMPQVFVPAGKFVMGPRNEVVEVAAFWIDQTEVTNAQYARCVAAGICEPPAGAGSQTRKFYFQNAEYDAYPVVYVAFDDAQTYCNWVGRRLPTGTEWEKAARGTDGWMYPWGDAAPDGTRANYGHQVGDSTAVGSYPAGASPYGVLDLAGNVAEWVDEEMDGGYRVSRGGSWTSEANAISAVVRYGVTPTRHFADYGFRCATRTAPAGVSEPPAAGTVTAAFAAGPNFSNFRACDRPCTEAGAQIVNVFPEKTTSIYVGWDYAGMQPEMPYTRIWSHGGVEWVRYYCLWRGPEQGTFSIRLWDNEGLRSGVWTLSISLDTVHDFTFNVPIEGVFDLFTPAGQLACPDFR